MSNQPSTSKIAIQHYIYPSVQVSLIKEDLLLFPRALFLTFNNNLFVYVNSLIAIPGWSGEFDIKSIYFIYYLFFSYVFYKTVHAFSKVNIYETILIAMIFFGTLVSLSLTMFLYGTPVGSTTIENLNGRYFILLIPVFIWLVWGLRNLFKSHTLQYGVIALTIAIICFSIYQRYYNTEAYYEQAVPERKVTRDELKILPVTNQEKILLSVNPQRKLAGIRVLVANKKEYISTYRIELKDRDCKVTLTSAVLNSYLLKDNAFNDVLMRAVQPEGPVVCVVFSQIAKAEETDSLKLFKSSRTQKIEIYPLYLY